MREKKFKWDYYFAETFTCACICVLLRVCSCVRVRLSGVAAAVGELNLRQVVSNQFGAFFSSSRALLHTYSPLSATLQLMSAALMQT